MDQEFDCLRDIMPGNLDLNTTAAGKHIPEIERQIRLLKERAHAIWSRLPFQKVPERITIELILFVVLWLNYLMPASGVLHTYSLRTIETGRTLDYKKNYKVELGAYVECHKDNDLSNTITERNHGGIYMGPTTNMQGSYTVFYLRTNLWVTRKQFYALPMPGREIQRFEKIATQENRDRWLIFADRIGDITYDGPGSLPVLDAISGVYGGNDDVRNTEEDYRNTDMFEDITDDTPDPPTENTPAVDTDTN